MWLLIVMIVISISIHMYYERTLQILYYQLFTNNDMKKYLSKHDYYKYMKNNKEG